jgi:hypothetical protein
MALDSDHEIRLRMCASFLWPPQCLRSTARSDRRTRLSGFQVTFWVLTNFVPYPRRQLSDDIDPSPASKHGQLSRTSYAQTWPDTTSGFPTVSGQVLARRTHGCGKRTPSAPPLITTQSSRRQPISAGMIIYGHAAGTKSIGDKSVTATR